MEPTIAQLEELARAERRVGSVVGDKWKLESVLGVGGMAAVYRAVHERNQRRVAIKIMHEELCHFSDVRERFAQEALAANLIDHRGVVPVLDDGVLESGTPFLVMEFLEGQSLQKHWEAHERLSVEEVFSLAEELLDILIQAHAAGVLHRDIKPENVFLTTEGEVKLLDFGISKVSRVGQTHKTEVGSRMGTPAFMSPEQALGRWEDLDPRADIFAVGAAMFSLLSGRPIHEAETPNELLLKVMTVPVRDLREVAPHVPDFAAREVGRALAFEREQRFPTVAAMRDAVRRVRSRLDRGLASYLDDELTDGGVDEPPPQRTTHRPVMFSIPALKPVAVHVLSDRRKWMLAAIFALMTVSAVLSFTFVRSGDRTVSETFSPVFSEPGHLRLAHPPQIDGEVVQLSDLPLEIEGESKGHPTARDRQAPSQRAEKQSAEKQSAGKEPATGEPQASAIASPLTAKEGDAPSSKDSVDGAPRRVIPASELE